MKKLFILFYLFLFSFFSYSQTITVNNSANSNIDGTYQIEIHNVRHLPYIPENLIEIVNNNRLENETFYFPLDSNIRIRIPSRNEIINPNFQKLEKIKYIN
jgi:hypothetical protein